MGGTVWEFLISLYFFGIQYWISSRKDPPFRTETTLPWFYIENTVLGSKCDGYILKALWHPQSPLRNLSSLMFSKSVQVILLLKIGGPLLGSLPLWRDMKLRVDRQQCNFQNWEIKRKRRLQKETLKNFQQMLLEYQIGIKQSK